VTDLAPPRIDSVRLAWIASAARRERGFSVVQDPAAQAFHQLLIVDVRIGTGARAAAQIGRDRAPLTVHTKQVDTEGGQRLRHDVHEALEKRKQALARDHLRTAYPIESLCLDERRLPQRIRRART